jgi:predicted transcriptional regulator
MVTLTVHLDDESAERLQRRADAAGLTIEQIATREVARSLQDPFEFVAIGEADLSALDTDELLAKGFGRR